MKIPTPTTSTNGTARVAGFNLDEFRLPQDFADAAGVKKVLTRVPVRKPDRHWFVRTHPDPAYHFTTALVEIKEDRDSDFYLVRPEALSGCMGELKPIVLHAAISRQGAFFLWPTKLPGRDGRDNLWNASARDAAEQAERCWVSVRSSTDVGGYEVFEATAAIPDPEWPTLTMSEIVELAFKDKILDRPDHPVLLRLQGVV
jgi:hypothetical protein